MSALIDENCFNTSFALSYAGFDRFLDLCNDEVIGKLSLNIEYEEFKEIRENIAALVDELLGLDK
ncbi:MAG: hypothetical protein ACR5K4_00130 [Sodalis sp. (in: enterobacteria)]